MSDDLRGLIELVYRAENGGKIDYDVIYGGIPRRLRPKKKPTDMTVREVMDWQQDMRRAGMRSTAIGALQIITGTLADRVRRGVVSPDDRFDAKTQDKLTVSLMQKRGLDRWVAGTMSTEDFGTNLAMEWASLPVLKATYRNGRPIKRGSAYYGGVGDNKSRALVGAAALEQVLGDPGNPNISLEAYGMTRGKLGAMEGATNILPGMSPRMAEQHRTQSPLGTTSYRAPWEQPDVSLERSSDASEGLPDRLAAPDYATRTGAGGGPVNHPGFGAAFADEWTDSFIVRDMLRSREADEHSWNLSFDPVKTAEQEGLKQHWRYLKDARSPEHYEQLKGNLASEERRAKRRAAYDGYAAPFLGAMLNPDTLISLAIPGAMGVSAIRSGGTNAMRSGASVAGLTAAYEIPLEMNRAGLDPMSSSADSLMRIGGATVFAGLIGAGAGALGTRGARKRLIQDVGRELALERGIGKTTGEIDLGGGYKGKVVSDGRSVVAVDIGSTPLERARGVTIAGGKVYVDEKTVLARWASGQHGTPAQSANELMEYEIAFAAERAKQLGVGERLKRFAKSESGAVGPETPIVRLDDKGRPVVDRKVLQSAIDEGRIIRLGEVEGMQGKKITPVEVDASRFKTVEEAERVLKAAADMAVKARDNREFRQLLEGATRGKVAQEQMTPEQTMRAKEAAERHLETWRKENNRILADAKTEALARLMDGPYKRVHRNAFAPEVVDLMDKMAADGAFLRGSDGSGVTIGTSVYSRGKTWGGTIHRLYEREGDLYEKYLGFRENPSVQGVRFNKELKKNRANDEKAITVEEFRSRATKALITGRDDAIGEVNEMAQSLRAFYDEFKGPAEEFGVVSSKKTLQTEIARLSEAMDELAIRAGENDPGAEWTEMARQLDDLHRQLKEAADEPSEDYFTRVWNKDAIRANREAFKDQIIKPWMVQQPFVSVWNPGKAEWRAKMRELEDAGVKWPDPRLEELETKWHRAPETSRYERVKTDSSPAGLEKRADDILETILEEAEPADLATLRTPHRPTFGRHRQFDIPNSHLLKDGPNGNGLGDFIVTDYLRVAALYESRMAPAIEFARSFARPKDGIDAHKGFDSALADARMFEFARWSKAMKKSKKASNEEAFEKHWLPIERDLLHMRDRVTNRVIRDPNRWDNRVATQLRNWSQLAFMGMSALPAMQEIGTVAMRHGLTRTMQAAFGRLDADLKEVMKAGASEMRLAGANLDIIMGGALSRHAEIGIDSNAGTALERWMTTNANRYFLLNGLAPVTSVLKDLDAGLRVSDTVARIRRVADLGKGASKEDLAELNRYGISLKDAEEMAKQPVLEVDGGWLANTDAWGDEGLVRKFRAAIAQGNENTILLATAADKPIIVDGAAYIRAGGMADKYAVALGLEKQGGYWRVQSGMMTLPFAYWNYAMAATNKILIAGLDEPSAQKLGGIAALVGLGYIVAGIRSPDFAWDQMTAGDKLTRAIDQSGVMGVLPQYGHLAQGTAIGTTGQNPFPWEMRNGQTDVTGVDAAFNLMGAGPSVARNAVEGALTQDAGRFRWALPWSNHFALNGLFDTAVDGIERRYAGVDA